MLCLGLLSGTSMDAVDAALVRFSPGDCELIAYRQFDFPDSLSRRLRAAGPATPVNAIVELDAEVGDAFAAAALQLIGEAGVQSGTVAAIGSHGQTLLHAPAGLHANTLQVGDPNRIAFRTRIRTVADFRRMDMAAGGQGAPLAPAFHTWKFSVAGVCRAVINIGGIANLTILPGSETKSVTGFDTGPGNLLLDLWVHKHSGASMDRDGAWAAANKVVAPLLEMMLADDYLMKPPPKSTGREYFHLDWLAGYLRRLPQSTAPGDVQSTLVELTAVSVARSVLEHAPGAREVLVCGGGTHNHFLMERLAANLLGIEVDSTARHGLDPDAVEATLFAWLAKCRMESVPGNVPAVTGAQRPVILGAIYEPMEVNSAK